MHDVYVEAAVDGRIVVESDTPIPAGETLALELSRDLDVRSLVSVQVATSTPALVDGARRYRLALSVLHPDLHPDGPSQADDAAHAAAAANRTLARAVIPGIGVLTRRVPVRVRDVSASGCQLESLDGLPEGSIGLLELSSAAGHQTETLRVCRSRRVPGAARPWRSGARFLGLRAPMASSLRNLAARFEIVDELGNPSHTWSTALRAAR